MDDIKERLEAAPDDMGIVSIRHRGHIEVRPYPPDEEDDEGLKAAEQLIRHAPEDLQRLLDEVARLKEDM